MSFTTKMVDVVDETISSILTIFLGMKCFQTPISWRQLVGKVRLGGLGNVVQVR